MNRNTTEELDVSEITPPAPEPPPVRLAEIEFLQPRPTGRSVYVAPTEPESPGPTRELRAPAE